MNRKRILLVQWGRRGAGPKLLIQLAQDLLEFGYEVGISFCTPNEYRAEMLEFFSKASIELKISKKISLISPYSILKNRKIFLSEVRSFDPSLVVYVMPHPWDILFRTELKQCRIIHDAQRHPGDSIWPRTSSQRRRVRLGDDVIVLSESVRLSLSKWNSNLRIASHPVFRFSKNSEDFTRSIDVLVIGRQRKYKGTAALSEIWPLVNKVFPEVKLTIAGQGRIPKRVKELRNVTIINKWLSDDDIDWLLKSSKSVLFPYIEASQSGILPAAKSFGAEVVATPVGGLIEQIRQHGGILSKACDPQSIADAIVLALSDAPSKEGRPVLKITTQIPIQIDEIVRMQSNS